jgi:TRAP-type C4-dicarboxylate transport system permease small subunit
MALLLMMAVVLVDVVGRSLFNAPLSSGTELTEMLMVIMTFTAFPVLAYRQRNIIVDLLDLLQSPALRKVQLVLAGLAGAAVFGLTARQLALFAQRAVGNGETTAELQFPLTYVWWFMSVLAAVTALASLVVMAQALLGRPVSADATLEKN